MLYSTKYVLLRRNTIKIHLGVGVRIKVTPCTLGKSREEEYFLSPVWESKVRAQYIVGSEREKTESEIKPNKGGEGGRSTADLGREVRLEEEEEERSKVTTFPE